MSIVKIDDLIKLLKNNGYDIDQDFSISFVDSDEHKKKYEETRDLHLSDGRTLNIDLDENENILSLEFLKFN